MKRQQVRKSCGKKEWSVTIDSRCSPEVHEQCRMANGGQCVLENMRIALVGGLDRLEDKYQEAFEMNGAEFRFHTGVSGGVNAIRLKTLSNWADVVVFVTTVNSHNALSIVKGICRKSGKLFLAMRHSGVEQVSSNVREHLLRRKKS